MPVPSADPRASQRAALRRAVLRLVIGVVLLHAVALSIYYGAGIAHGPSRTRTIYVIAWSIATALVVGVLLRKVRQVRWQGKR